MASSSRLHRARTERERALIRNSLQAIICKYGKHVVRWRRTTMQMHWAHTFPTRHVDDEQNEIETPNASGTLLRNSFRI
jgi:hypothetical protein